MHVNVSAVSMSIKPGILLFWLPLHREQGKEEGDLLLIWVDRTQIPVAYVNRRLEGGGS